MSYLSYVSEKIDDVISTGTNLLVSEGVDNELSNLF
jgi:hypothetical protein